MMEDCFAFVCFFPRKGITFVFSHVQFAFLGLLRQYLIHTRYALPSELHPQPCGFHSVLALINTDVELSFFLFSPFTLCNSPSWFRTHFVEQAGLEHSLPLPPNCWPTLIYPFFKNVCYVFLLLGCLHLLYILSISHLNEWVTGMSFLFLIPLVRFCFFFSWGFFGWTNSLKYSLHLNSVIFNFLCMDVYLHSCGTYGGQRKLLDLEL